MVTVEDGGTLPVDVLRQRVATGAEQARLTRKGTREALRAAGDARKKAPASSRRKAAQASVRSRVDRKFAVLDEVADYLEANPGLRHAKSREIAEKLNEAGIRTGWNNLWTPGSVRPKLKAIKAELDFRQETAAEDAADAPGVAGDLSTASPSSTASSSAAPAVPTIDTASNGARPSPAPASQPQPTPVIGQQPVDADNVPAEDPEEDADEIAMRKLPYFGMF